MVLATASRSYPKCKGRLLTRYSPVRHSTESPKRPFAFDLHVLSTPPTFVLSQDQTLQFDILNLFAEIIYCIHLITQDLNKGVNFELQSLPM